MARPGLGRGLGALIPDSADPSRDATGDAALGASRDATRDAKRDDRADGVRSVPVGAIVPNPDQPRKCFDEASIAELAESIRRHGVIQPLILEELPGSAPGEGRYRIVAGERRWRAATAASLPEVPALVRVYGREKRLEVALVENVQREDLNAMDEAEAYRQIMEVTGLTQDQVAERVGKSRPTVANSLRLLNLPPDAMEAVRTGTISAGHARAILAVPDEPGRAALLARVVRDGLSVREAEAAAAARRPARPEPGKSPAKHAQPPMDPDLAALEQQLIGRLGTKVSIRGDSRRGTITVEYYSMDDLDRVYEIIAGDGRR